MEEEAPTIEREVYEAELKRTYKMMDNARVRSHSQPDYNHGFCITPSEYSGVFQEYKGMKLDQDIKGLRLPPLTFVGYGYSKHQDFATYANMIKDRIEKFLYQNIDGHECLLSKYKYISMCKLMPRVSQRIDLNSLALTCSQVVGIINASASVFLTFESCIFDMAKLKVAISKNRTFPISQISIWSCRFSTEDTEESDHKGFERLLKLISRLSRAYPNLPTVTIGFQFGPYAQGKEEILRKYEKEMNDSESPVKWKITYPGNYLGRVWEIHTHDGDQEVDDRLEDGPMLVWPREYDYPSPPDHHLEPVSFDDSLDALDFLS